LRGGKRKLKNEKNQSKTSLVRAEVARLAEGESLRESPTSVGKPRTSPGWQSFDPSQYYTGGAQNFRRGEKKGRMRMTKTCLANEPRTQFPWTPKKTKKAPIAEKGQEEISPNVIEPF